VSVVLAVVIVAALPYVGVHGCNAGALIGVRMRAAHSFCGQPSPSGAAGSTPELVSVRVGQVIIGRSVRQAAFSSVARTW
jgi:hypothetical protein